MYLHSPRDLEWHGTSPARIDFILESLKILKKQKAQYTDRARQAGVQGTLTMAVLFGASGKVEQILPIKRLGYGLDEQAIGAAYMMEFEPLKPS